MKEWMGISATLLSPLYYHGIYVPDGSATDPRALTDTGMVFALSAALGCSPTLHTRQTPEYRADLMKVPWRASLFLAENARLLAPVRHIIDVEREGGNTETMQSNMASGNFKKTFYVHEIEIGAVYHGALFGPNPFKAYHTDSIVIRMGVGRTGLVQLKPQPVPEKIVVNTATLALFGHKVPEAYRIMDTIRPSHALSIAEVQAMFDAC